MALPSSGNISMNDVNTEFKRTGTSQISFNDLSVRDMFEKTVPGEAISLSNGYSKVRPKPSGGTLSTSGSNTLHTFTESGKFITESIGILPLFYRLVIAERRARGASF